MIAVVGSTPTMFANAILLSLLLVTNLVSSEGDCAHVIDGTATQQSSGNWLISATVSSTETGWDKYADEWKVEYIDDDGTMLLGTRTLAHPHENEQPFTRSLSGVSIPDDITVVTLSARDSVLGYCGDSYELSLGRETDVPAATFTTAPTTLGNDNVTTGMSFNETFANTTLDDDDPSNSTEFTSPADL